MEVKIGISDSPRELVINSAQTQDEVEKLVSGALGSDGGVLALSDEKGRKFLIQASKVAYVEIGSTTGGRVGFAAV
ncbi:DUF3107 domain-containing protein [Streptomyces gardneri]|uniref:DUF3107 domain-containing protein n=1 Tax=Nocardia TaxID=1817 RepID=UPI00135B0753|nr:MULTISPECIES: DUF3107 domain-containing protein [Nocardia]MBF6163571.1 DUF3107 domain-containing protein [Streptomyces gardneri]MBF6207649.1 DUF3107 domain-containing protein [Streptomyces gardneri]